jgi:uncharacterized YigZ family protein
MEKESFETIRQNCEKETEKVKGSRFIGRIYRVHDRGEAELELEKVRKKFFDATHNCFAYTVGRGACAVIRSSDDGEPSGTAGRPIMTVLESSGLSDVLLVVTRYYGGTNLGTGGLIKAYTEAAKAAVGAAPRETVEIRRNLRFRYSYDMTSLVMNILGKYEGVTVSEEFNDGAVVTVSVNSGFAGHFTKELFERSNGLIKAELC